MKKLILVAGVPASGKNYVSSALLRSISGAAYFDKDDLCDLVDCALRIADQPSNRDTDFFNQNIKPYEYLTIERLALTALRHAECAIVNAPYISQLSDAAYMTDLRRRANECGAELAVIWIAVPEKEVLRQRMLGRASARDEWKLLHFDEYYESVRLSAPSALKERGIIDELIVFLADTEREFSKSLELSLKYIKG